MKMEQGNSEKRNENPVYMYALSADEGACEITSNSYYPYLRPISGPRSPGTPMTKNGWIRES
jgi:hypothetical protein